MTPLAPEVLTHLGPIPITNTLINTFIVDGVILAAIFLFTKNFKRIPGLFQNIVELIVGGFYDLTVTIAGNNAPKIFPYFMSFFLFILVANWSGLIPGIATFGFFHGTGSEKEFVPLIRNATSDLNVTLALSLISLVATHILAVSTVGIKEYLSRYFSLNPINLFVGILEIVGEVTKLISLSFRLFGNIFAGEIVIGTISSLFAFIVPLPFLLLEIIVGLVQALVFSMLTMVFMSILMTPHHAEEHAEAH